MTIYFIVIFLIIFAKHKQFFILKCLKLTHLKKMYWNFGKIKQFSYKNLVKMQNVNNIKVFRYQSAKISYYNLLI